MRIGLKKFRSSRKDIQPISEYTAVLYINGISVATVGGHDSGKIEIQPDSSESVRLLSGADLYCKSLPPRWIVDGTYTGLLQMKLTAYVHGLADDIQFQRQLARDMHTNILIGDPEKRLYRKHPLKDYSIWHLLKYPEGTEMLRQILLEDVMPTLQPGEMVLNPTIPHDLLVLVNKRQEIIAQRLAEATIRNSLLSRKHLLSRRIKGP